VDIKPQKSIGIMAAGKLFEMEGQINDSEEVKSTFEIDAIKK